MPKSVIAIKKDKLMACSVSPDSKTPVTGAKEYGWDMQTLDLTFEAIAKQYSARRWRILVGEELSYVVRFSLPHSVRDSELRSAAKAELAARVPEELKENQWDFKQLGVKGESSSAQRELIAFALVGGLAGAITRAAEKGGFAIEAIEPEIISRTRDANPLVGIALKDDIAGDDKSALNIRPGAGRSVIDDISPDPIYPNDPQESEEKNGNKTKNIIMIAIIVFLLFGLGIYLFGDKITQILPIAKPEQPDSAQEAQASPEPEAEDAQPEIAEDTAKETAQEINVQERIKELAVGVQNGTGVAGEASFVRDMLVTAGFENVQASNAPSYGRVDTAIGTKKTVEPEVVEFLRSVLSDTYQLVVTEGFVADDDAIDILVIVGARK